MILLHRIAELRKQHHLSQAALGRKLGVAQNTICNWENGVREPANEYLLRLADIFGVSMDDLMGRQSPPSPGVWINVLGEVAAGIPIEAVEDIIDQEEIPAELAHQGEYFGLKIKGDSMEPKISDGDVVIVRRQEDVETGDIAVVLVNGNTATVKRIKKQTDGIMLIPTNPAYEPLYYNNQEILSLPVSILGKVIELRAKL